MKALLRLAGGLHLRGVEGPGVRDCDAAVESV